MTDKNQIVIMIFGLPRSKQLVLQLQVDFSVIVAVSWRIDFAYICTYLIVKYTMQQENEQAL